MTPEELTEKLADLNPEAVLFEPRDLYDKAIIALTNDPQDHWTRRGQPWVAVYDYDRLVECTMTLFGVGEEQMAGKPDSEAAADAEVEAFDAAQEWVDFNMAGLWAGDGTPFIHSFDRVEYEDEDLGSGEDGDQDGVDAEPQSKAVGEEYVN